MKRGRKKEQASLPKRKNKFNSNEEGFSTPPRREIYSAGVAFDKTSDSGAPRSDAALQPVLQLLQ